MKIHIQIAMDKWLARPFAILLNYVVRLVGKIAHIDHSLDREFTCIAICKFKGMGSILQATPMLSALAKRYPKAEIIFISTKTNHALLKEIPSIQTIYCLDDSSLLPLLRTCCTVLFSLLKKRPGVYIDLEIYSDFSSIFAALSLATNRLGFYLRSSTFRLGIYTHHMYFNTRVPVSDVYLQFASMFSRQQEEESLYSFPLLKKTNTLFPTNYIVINPNASDLRLERRWGITNFISMINYLLESMPTHDILIVGSKNEIAYCAELCETIANDRVRNTAGEFTISDLITCIQNATFMISNDTGPMHIALSVKTPVICLFGPCSPEQYKFPENAHVLYKRVYCSPCVHDFDLAPCKGNNICMQQIVVMEVIKAFDRLMHNIPPIKTTDEIMYYNEKENTTIGLVNR